MNLAALTLLELIDGLSPEQINVVLPTPEFKPGLDALFAVDFNAAIVVKKRDQLRKDAQRAIRMGAEDRMRRRLLARLNERMQGRILAGKPLALSSIRSVR